MTIIIHPAIAVLLIGAALAIAFLRRRPTPVANMPAAPRRSVGRKKFETIPTLTEPSYVNGKGYVMVKAVGHPLAGVGGYVREHRKVLYDTIGNGPHPCRWCGRQLDWVTNQRLRRLIVDHVDGDKQNNDVDNLVPACVPCNVARHAPLKPVNAQQEAKLCKDCDAPIEDAAKARCDSCHRTFERERKRIANARKRLLRTPR